MNCYVISLVFGRERDRALHNAFTLRMSAKGAEEVGDEYAAEQAAILLPDGYRLVMRHTLLIDIEKLRLILAEVRGSA